MSSSLATQVRDEPWIPHHMIGPRDRAPRLALVADFYGHELNGMFVLSRLAAFLHEIEAGVRDGLRMQERVVIVPTASGSDRGRGSVHAGAAATSLSGRQQALWMKTEALLSMTRVAYYRVDMHTVNLEIEEMPQVRLYAPSDDERASACLFGLPAVIERPLDQGVMPGLVRAWHQQGGENFVIHAGQAGNLQPGHCETLFRGLVAFLDRTGIVSGLHLAEEEDDLHYFSQSQVFVVLAELSGLFSSCLEVGRWVQAGDELGRVYDSFTGELRASVIAPQSGLLASLRRQPLLCEGDLVARILRPDRAERRARVR